MWQSLLVYNASPQPQTKATVLVSPSLLQIDTFGRWCRCLHNVCYVKLKKRRYLKKMQIICNGWHLCTVPIEAFGCCSPELLMLSIQMVQSWSSTATSFSLSTFVVFFQFYKPKKTRNSVQTPKI